MGQKKLQRFADIKNFSNVLEYPVAMQGKWNSFFKNDNPIVLELACGRGEYTVGLSALFSEKNFIGVDVKGNRMYIGAKKCLEANINNAAFLRTQITLLLRLYQQILQPNGCIHLKTDSPKLYAFTKQVIEMYQLLLVEDCNDVYASNPSESLSIKTHYEALDIAGSNTIYYLQFQLPTTIPNLDEQLQQLLKETENQ